MSEPRRLHPADVQAIIDGVLDGLAERSLSPTPRLVGTEEVASALGVSREYVYQHASALGGRKIGSGPRAQWRFDIAEASEALRHASSEPEAPSPAPRRRSRRRRSGSTANGVPLLPIRGVHGEETT